MNYGLWGVGKPFISPFGFGKFGVLPFGKGLAKTTVLPFSKGLFTKYPWFI